MSARFSPTRLKLLGSGTALPGPAVGNEQLLAYLDRHCSPGKARLAGRLAKRLGITARHVSRDLSLPLSGTRPGFDAPSLCQQALQQALQGQAMSYLLGHTATPHTLLPSNVAWVAEKMDFAGPYLELRQACTGFANALSVAAAMIAENTGTTVGIVGSETGSAYFRITEDFADREQLLNFVQMGDGAGAVAVTADDGAGGAVISDVFVGQVGKDKAPGIRLSGGGSADPACSAGLPYFRHDARSVRRHGEQLLAAGVDAIQSRGLALEDFDWIIPHQANGLMAELLAARFPATRGKVFVTADRLGNMGSAAIWVSFDTLRRSGQLHQGQRVLVLGAEASKYLYGGFVYTH